MISFDTNIYATTGIEGCQGASRPGQSLAARVQTNQRARTRLLLANPVSDSKAKCKHDQEANQFQPR
jgi:uncharacterized Zn finger protein